MKEKGDGPTFTRREIIKLGAAGGAGFFLATRFGAPPTLFAQAIPGGTLIPTNIPKFAIPTINPPAMPKAVGSPVGADYEIAVRQFDQQILPLLDINGLPLRRTRVWSYCAAAAPLPVAQGGTLHYPSLTIEATANVNTRVKWINGLVDKSNNFLKHLLPVDQTLHWANPPGGPLGKDMHGMLPDPYQGPVPISIHVHGAHTYEHSDGHPQAWFLPAAKDIDPLFATTGRYYDIFKANAMNGALWGNGAVVFDYPNDQRATTLWYHDHALGMTRVNVYAGPAGFYLIRGGPDDLPAGVLPSGPKGEVSLAIQDRAFNANGQLFYPNTRAFFEGLTKNQLKGLYAPSPTLTIDPLTGMSMMSDIAPIWNPEFFGNVMVVNGYAWPFYNVEQRRYRLRLLNGCDSRFLILKFGVNQAGTDQARLDLNGVPIAAPNLTVHQIGAEQGFLAAPVEITALENVAGTGLNGVILMGPAERADLIVDFTNVPRGTVVQLVNLGPDAPFGGGVAGTDFVPADPATTGQVMQFKVGPIAGTDASLPAAGLGLPAIVPQATPITVRSVSLNEAMSMTVNVAVDAAGAPVTLTFDPVRLQWVIDPLGRITAFDPLLPPPPEFAALGLTIGPFGPVQALLGTWTAAGGPVAKAFGDPVTETPAFGTSEVWEFFNFTVDAHPIHIHLVQFQVVNRQPLDPNTGLPVVDKVTGLPVLQDPEPWENGYKDTVIAYPGQVTRVQSTFDIRGQYVWHCHIVEHEDNEMMRPFTVV